VVNKVGAPEDVEKSPKGGSALRSVLGWTLIVIAVVGGAQNMAHPSPGTAPTAVTMITIGMGLILRWSGKTIGITVASIFLLTIVFWIAVPIR